MTYDDHACTATVKVTDAGNGKLDLSVTYGDGDKAIFENKYVSEGSVAFEAEKTLNGRSLTADEFEFVLKDTEGKEISTAKNDAAGKVIFDAISYTQADINKEYTYTIAETAGSEASMTYDMHECTVIVKVTDAGKGKLDLAVTYSDGEKASFENEYSASGKTVFEAEKTLTGRTLEADEFEFLLKDAEGKEISTVKNDADGKIVFDEISYTQADINKEYTYTIAEIAGNEAGMTYDGHACTVTVKVTDAGNGALNCVVTYGDGEKAEFTNSYRAAGNVSFEAKKTLTGRKLTADEFEFVLKDAEGKKISTTKNDADGKIVFDEISYTEADINKEYTYTIAEIEGKKGGVIYDKHICTVTVDVIDIGGGKLNCAMTYSDGDQAIFVNKYKASGNAVINAEKKLEGRSLQKDEFEFVLKDAEGNEISKEKNSDDGKITFPTISYTEVDTGKEFTYTITETNNGAENITFDTHVEMVTVKVSDNGDGTMTTEVVYDEEGAVFKNIYTAETEVETERETDTETDTETKNPPTQKTTEKTPEKSTGENPRTGDDNNIVGMLMMMFVSAGMICTSLFLKSRKREEQKRGMNSRN